MKKANISKIKAELSKYLRLVRSGEEVMIMDRDQPVAKLVGVHAANTVVIRHYGCPDPGSGGALLMTTSPGISYFDSSVILRYAIGHEMAVRSLAGFSKLAVTSYNYRCRMLASSRSLAHHERSL